MLPINKIICGGGSGTTLKKAAQLRRDYVGVEIKKEYIKMAEKRAMQGETGLTTKEQRAGQMALRFER